MSEAVRFRCINCGERFTSDVLDEQEKMEARRRGRPTSAIRCPQCGRDDLRRGWE
jgi:DNA-directed RNA polymerase subunit RPC12/RpoP